MIELDWLAPKFGISINGEPLGSPFTDLVLSMEYESCADIIDKGKILLADPDLLLMDDPRFLPGGTADCYFGYGEKLTWVGRFEIRNFNPILSTTDVSTLEISGYDGSWLLAEADGDGTVFKDMTYPEIAKFFAQKHGMEEDIEDDPPLPKASFIHKKGTSDYKLLSGLAAAVGKQFKVYLNRVSQSWVLYWGPPIVEVSDQFEFRFDPHGTAGSGPLLRDVELDLSMQQLKTGVVLYYFDSTQQSWEKVEVETKDTGEQKFKNKTKIEKSLSSAESFLVEVSGKSLEVAPGQTFKSAEEAYKWAQSWYQSRKDEFVICKGHTMGLPMCYGGQTHFIKGVGKLLSGEYYFPQFHHKFTGEGYGMNFIARKILEGSQ